MSGGAGDDRKSIKELGWRQGSILPRTLVKDLLGEHPETLDPEQEILVVVSHDCDVTNASFDSEPRVELLKATMLDASRRDGALRYGKNPRKIQFKVQVAGDVGSAEANAYDRFFTPREILLDCAPDPKLSCTPLAIRQISDWLARRYVRVAFPDAFNNRIGRSEKPIRRALKSAGRYITAVFVAMESWAELAEDEPYRIMITMTMKDDDFNNPTKRRAAQGALDRLEEKLGTCDGIEIIEASLANEQEVSLADRRLMHRFDFDDLSFRDEGGDLAPRG